MVKMNSFNTIFRRYENDILKPFVCLRSYVLHTSCFSRQAGYFKCLAVLAVQRQIDLSADFCQNIHSSYFIAFMASMFFIWFWTVLILIEMAAVSMKNSHIS